MSVRFAEDSDHRATSDMRLKTFGFAFDRQAAGSHEIWYNEKIDRYTTMSTIPE